jgi:hypothetical protein
MPCTTVDDIPRRPGRPRNWRRSDHTIAYLVSTIHLMFSQFILPNHISIRPCSPTNQCERLPDSVLEPNDSSFPTVVVLCIAGAVAANVRLVAIFGVVPSNRTVMTISLETHSDPEYGSGNSCAGSRSSAKRPGMVQ